MLVKSDSKEEEKCLEKIRNLSNRKHNIEVMKDKKNQLQVIYRPKGDVSPECCCTADFPFWSYPTCYVANLHAGPVGCISYNMQFLTCSC